jgi:hypothetical protein
MGCPLTTPDKFIVPATINLDNYRPVFLGEIMTFIDSTGDIHEAVVLVIRKDTVDVLMTGPLPLNHIKGNLI